MLSKTETRAALRPLRPRRPAAAAASTRRRSTSAASPTSSRRSSATTLFGGRARGARRARRRHRGRDRDRARRGSAAGSKRDGPVRRSRVACARLRRRRRRAGHEQSRPAPTCGGAGRIAAGLPHVLRRVRPQPGLPALRRRRPDRSSIPAPAATARGACSRSGTLEVEIPPGSTTASASGSPARATPAPLGGQRRRPLRARPRPAPRPRFVREGDDVFSTVDLTMTAGRARHDGRRSRRSTARSSSSSTRARSRARCASSRGRGMPVLQGFGRGDHRVLVNVAVPHAAHRRAARACSRSSSALATEKTYQRRRGLLREAEERVPLSLARARRSSSRASGPRRRVRAMLELFPGGLRGDRAQPAGRRARRVHGRGGRRAGCGSASARSRASPVADGWEDEWKRFHRPVRVGALWIGPAVGGRRRRGLTARRDRSRPRVRDRRAPDDAALPRAPGRDSSAGSLLDVGCGSGVLAIAGCAARLRAGSRDRLRRGRGRGDRAECRGQRRRRWTFATSTLLAEPLPGGGGRRREHRSARRSSSSASAASAVERSSPPATSRATSPQFAGFARRRAARPRGLGRRPVRAASSIAADGDVLGSLPRLQGVARRRACDPRGAAPRRARASARRRPTSRSSTPAASRTRRSRKSRQAAARAARTHRRVYVTGCGANLAGDAFDGPARRTSSSSRAGARRRRAFVAGDVGAIGCVQADARLDRVRAFVQVQDGCSFSCNFCVIPLVRGGIAQPERRRRARARSAAASTRATARSS